MQSIARQSKQSRRSIGFVPTLGALHKGHLSLIRCARRENNLVVVSIFVNPAQFSRGEDYLRYPRSFKTDIALCKKEGVDIVFCPPAGQIYPKGYKTYIIVEQLSDLLCGRFRRGHFQGVATIVAKLFNIIAPDAAYFGQKDAQQAVIIRRMAKDLNLPVKIRLLPIIREADGLAMSSRNAYLNKQERKDAACLYAGLKKARAMVAKGIKDSAEIKRACRRVIKEKKNARIQYIEIVDLEELKPVRKVRKRVLLALAVCIGKTRLIDNLIL